MRKFNMLSGLPRSGSTLLCNLLNMNTRFHATPTSGVIEVVKSMRSTISSSITWRAKDRLSLLPNIQKGLEGFVEGFYFDKEVVFDKCRVWSSHLQLMDEVLGNNDSKIIWTYRDPVEIIGSIESKYQKTILLENMDESGAPMAFSTLDRRIGTYTAPEGLLSYPIECLRDAIDMGYRDRILILTYYDITNNTQMVMDTIHDFIGEPRQPYDLSQLKQSTFEFDGFYNYKFPHSINEGNVKYKQSSNILPEKYKQAINERFAGLNNFILNNDPSGL